MRVLDIPYFDMLFNNHTKPAKSSNLLAFHSPCDAFHKQKNDIPQKAVYAFVSSEHAT